MKNFLVGLFVVASLTIVYQNIPKVLALDTDTTVITNNTTTTVTNTTDTYTTNDTDDVTTNTTTYTTTTDVTDNDDLVSNVSYGIGGLALGCAVTFLLVRNERHI